MMVGWNMMHWRCVSKDMIVFQGTRAIKYFQIIIEVDYDGRFKMYSKLMYLMQLDINENWYGNVI